MVASHGQPTDRCTNEVKEGGTVHYSFKAGQSDANIEIHGQYETVKPNEQLVYSWIWQLPHQPAGKGGDYKLNIRFEPSGMGSRLQVQQENFDSEDAVQPHQEGWEKALEGLKTYLCK